MRLDASNSDLFVYTEREGALSAVGHDLALRMCEFRVELDPNDGTGKAEFHADSLQVVGASGAGGRIDPDTPGRRDRAKIEAHIRKDVLRSDRHPLIRAWIERVDPVAEDGFELTVELELVGTRGQLIVPLRHRRDRWVAEATIHQPSFGIEPFRAFLGALRLKEEVRVELTTARELGAELRGGG